MKKVLSLVLVLAMALMMVPATAFANNTNANELLVDDSYITINNTSIKSSNTSNFSSMNKIGSVMDAVSDLPELDVEGKTREELFAQAKANMPDNSISFVDRHDSADDFNVVNTKAAPDEHLSGIISMKEKRAAEMKEKIAKSHAIHEKNMAKTAEEKATVADNVVLVTNETELAAMAEQEGYYRLANDIVLTKPWNPISFYGYFQGAGYTIYNLDLTAYKEYDYVGLFDYLGEDALVENINIIAPEVYANGYTGALCALNDGSISNCQILGGMVITYLWSSDEYAFWEYSGSFVGGLVGVNNGIISDCSVNIDVDGWTNVGGLVGENRGYIFFCCALGNVAYETNVYDVDYDGADYYAQYGEDTVPTYTTFVRFMWGALWMGEADAIAYGLNGGLVGANYYYVVDSCAQGAGTTEQDYGAGVVAGLYAAGGFVGGDAGYIPHCYVINKVLPVLPDGSELYYPWFYADEGYGIYFDWEAILIHKCLAMNAEAATDSAAELFYFESGSAGPSCDDGFYHGTPLTADQFCTASTFKNWNKAEWNEFDIWIFEDGYVPYLDACPITPAEFVITYTCGNSGGLLDGATTVYRCVTNDIDYGSYEPEPPKATNTQSGYGIQSWSPSTPYEGKQIVTDVTYVATFGKDFQHTGDVNENGELDTGDAVAILRYVLGAVKLTLRQMKNADYNYDDIVNGGDAVAILRAVVGLES